MRSQSKDMRTNRGVIGLIAAVLAALALATVFAFVAGSPGEAQEEPPPPIAAELLAPLAEFTDDVAVQVRDKPDGRRTDAVNLRDASNLVVARITIQPGAMFPWHIHPGPVLVAVTEGVEDPLGDEDPFRFIYADDCVERAYGVGEAFVDPGDSVHMAYNPSDQPTVVVATFLGVPEGAELTQPIAPGDGAALDDECDIDRG